jgi:hypothetical protein
MERLLIPINWTVGTLALILALVWPFLNTRINIPAIRAEAEGTVKLLVDAERQIYYMQRPFVLFSDSALPPELASKVTISNVSRYDYEAFINPKGQLVLRAYTKPPEVLKGSIIPGVYEFIMDSGGAIRSGQWWGLSDSQRSLF